MQEVEASYSEVKWECFEVRCRLTMDGGRALFIANKAHAPWSYLEPGVRLTVIHVAQWG